MVYLNKKENKMDIIELQAEGISNSTGYINDSELTVAITTGKKLLNNESVSDDDMEIFNNACAAIVEPNMRDTAFEAYCEFMENDMDNWVSWISQTFGEDWGTLADIIRQYGY